LEEAAVLEMCGNAVQNQPKPDLSPIDAKIKRFLLTSFRVMAAVLPHGDSIF
jgi:hypothetical protein